MCRTCAKTQQTVPCHHNDDDRALFGSYISLALEKAIELGYEVKRIDCVWHFEKREQYDPLVKTGGLFTKYMNTFF